MPLSHRSTSCSHRSIEPSIDQISSVPAVNNTLARCCKFEKVDGDFLSNWGQSLPLHDQIDCMYPPHGTCYSRMESLIDSVCDSETCPYRHVPSLNLDQLRIYWNHNFNHLKCNKDGIIEPCDFIESICGHCYVKISRFERLNLDWGVPPDKDDFKKNNLCMQCQMVLNSQYKTCVSCTNPNFEPDHMEREHYDPSDDEIDEERRRERLLQMVFGNEDSGTDYDTSDGEDALFRRQEEEEEEEYEFFAAPIVMPRVLVENIDERSIPRIPPSLGGSGLPPIASLRELRRFD